MRLLLDTHVLLWYYLDDPQLKPTARSMIEDPINRIFASPANHWEVAIKLKTGKIKLGVPFRVFIQEAIHDNGFSIIPIEPTHTEILTTLPLHHRDPFDRMLVAQTISEGMSILSADAILDLYPVQRLW